MHSNRKKYNINNKNNKNNINNINNNKRNNKIYNNIKIN
jgi:hypothetical protein